MEVSVLGGFTICRPEPLLYCSDSIQGFTLISDLHIGAPNVDYKMIQDELRVAQENGDRILINGDVFDLILTRDTKRFSQQALHPRLRGRQDTVNAALEWALELLSPVADSIDVIGVGNHETAVERHHDLDVVKILIYELEKQLPAGSMNHRINYGGYAGFVDYRFRTVNQQGEDARSNGKRLLIHFYHGCGGSSPSNKGMPDFGKRHWVDADVMWMGHKHNRFNACVQVVKCPKAGDDLIVKDVRYVMTGSYQDVYGGQSQDDIRANGRRSNYAADAGFAPQGKGGARLVLHFGATDEPFVVKVVQ